MAARSEDHLDVILPTPAISQVLPISGAPFARPDPALIQQLYQVGSATASALLHKMGVRQTFIQGPLPRVAGAKVVGPVVTLQFMPQREDVASGMAQEHVEKVSALWAVFDTVQPGDTLVSISRKFYKSSVRWQRILDANPDILSKPSDLKPGQMLVIP